MLGFKPLGIEDKDTFDSYMNPYNFLTSEYSFTNLFIWRKGCEIEYTTLKGALIIKKKNFEGQSYFMQPVGYKRENLKEIVEILSMWKKELNLDYLFGDAEADFIKDINDILANSLTMDEDRDNFDYIYESVKLGSLSGKKLHRKKNHYNFFVKNYAYEVREITEEIMGDCLSLAEVWYENNDENDDYLLYELESIKDLLGNMKKLNLKGIAVYIENKLEAFTIGEKLNDDMALIHIEKANPDIRGLYTFINKTFVQSYFSDVKYINREQDLGIESLRKAKESYYPAKLEPKYILNNCSYQLNNYLLQAMCRCAH
jgi:hypothetical protein